MYWRDIDTIGPRRPVRVRQNNRMRQPDTHHKVRVPSVVDEPLVEQTPSERQGESLQWAHPAAKNDVISTQEPDWQETAQRLQAEMDNFRKRQERRADESVSRERERLLTLFLPAIDNLSRALAHQNGTQPNGTEESLRQGVELTHRELMRVLGAEGVTQLETIGQSFDPEWQEAVATIPAEVESGTVVEQVEAGYKLGDKLLRPAKVVVAA